MAVFSSTPFAVDCAIDIQREFHRYNSDKGEPIHIRIGLDCGEPIEDINDFFGTTVQLAARLCAAAESDQILISDKTPAGIWQRRCPRAWGSLQAERLCRAGPRLSLRVAALITVARIECDHDEPACR